jgi:hypothetical protein
MAEVENQSGADTSPPIGKRIELPISFRQPEDVSLLGEWVHRFSVGVVAPLQQGRDLIAGLVARLPGGRKKIPRAPIIEVAEKAIERFVDHSLHAFVDRVRGLLEAEHIESPRRTVLKEICRPIYLRALMIKLAERVIKEGVPPSQSDFFDQIRDLLKNESFGPPEDLEEICAPIYARALSAKR